jgi:Spy/CpxP family protein refolding chaperone
MNDERTPRQIRLLTALLLFGTFLLGAVAGVGLSHWNRFPPPHRPGHPPFLPGPPGALRLTAEQQAKAHAITQRYRPELDAIWRDQFPKVKAVNDKMEKELREVLTPEQQKILDDMKAHRPPMPPGDPMAPGGPPPGGPPPGVPGMPPPGAGPPLWLPGLPPLPPPGSPK